MPKINKSFHLEVTVEQFLNACSLLELEEVNLRLDSYLRKARFTEKRKLMMEELDIILAQEGKDPETPGIELEKDWNGLVSGLEYWKRLSEDETINPQNPKP